MSVSEIGRDRDLRRRKWWCGWTEAPDKRARLIELRSECCTVKRRRLAQGRRQVLMPRLSQTPGNTAVDFSTWRRTIAKNQKRGAGLEIHAAVDAYLEGMAAVNADMED